VRSHARVVISLPSIGRAFVVEVGADCVRPLLERRNPHYRFIPSMPVSVPGGGGPELSQVPLVSAASPRPMIERN